ncbi:MAG: tRNA (guanosine(37)-N1)-methyltransferase TrmD [Bacillota bacterium]|nr:tRNA (guanosine(37)-N1)-methyltransferase TrmD [Bacillota bacterium]
MKIDIVTIFPGLVEPHLQMGMWQKAIREGKAEIRAVDLRSFTADRHATTDDYPFGGGPGMVMKPEPLGRAVAALKREGTGKVLLMSPQGAPFHQAMARRLAREAHLIVLCGRYEGVDQRVREALVDEEISLGDFILTGGELAALAIAEAVIRLLPGVLGAEEGPVEESFSRGLLEAPHYTRPREWQGRSVPDVLLSGDHGAIARWRRAMALVRTMKRRPDLLAKVDLVEEDYKVLAKLRLEEETR